MSAEQYLRIAIIESDEHLAEGYQVGIMYQKYSKDLTQQQLNDLIAFLLTLK